MLLFSFSPGFVYAQNPAKQATQCGINAAAGANGCNPDPAATSSINNTIKQIINILSVLVGIIAVIMIILAGFRYVTSGGDSARVAGAKSTLLYAIIGLIIVALAQVIVRFVLDKVT
jgi:hypothetical protein